MPADVLAKLDAKSLEVPIDELVQISVVATIVNGNKVAVP